MVKLSALTRNRRQRRKSQSGETWNVALPPVQHRSKERSDGDLQRLPNALGQAALLEWLGQPPIAFHRSYVDIAGGVLPALWLSSAMDRVATAASSSFERNGDFVFALSSQECEALTGLTNAQQMVCRKQLIDQGLISKESEREQAVVFRLHLNRIASRLLIQAAPLAEQLEGYEPLPATPIRQTPRRRAA